MLSIIICTYKRPELLKRCLAGALQTLEAMDAEVIVVNDDKAGTVVVPPRVTLLNNPGQGVASARNFGAKHASGDLLLFVDDDIEFTAAHVEGILKDHAIHRGACFNPNWKYSDELYAQLESTQFGRFLIRYQLINYQGWVAELDWQDSLFEARQLAAFFMLVPKKSFDAVNGFNEAFTNQGTEDDELCKRLRAAGVRMFVDPQICVFHDESDRISLEARLSRFYNGAVNRRKAFDLGDESYRIDYSRGKMLLWKSLVPFKKLLVATTKLIPNKPVFDPLYFLLSNALVALVIYDGYHTKN